MRRSVVADMWRGFRLNGLASPANGSYPSRPCVFRPCLSLSFLFLSVWLAQLIIQMSAAGSLPSKGVAGMFSKVAFLFVMWNQSPRTQQRYPQLTPNTAVLPIKERSTTAAYLITKRRKSDLNHYHPHHFCHCRPLSCSTPASRRNHHIAVAAP